jgi:2-polyprenyl-3-methyl-5-hydroxy-6-metoxy-1,4-benzoquinol methylase
MNPSLENRRSGPRPSRVLAAAARLVIWPLRRFFDARFEGVAQRIDVKHGDLVSRLDIGSTEVTALREELATQRAENRQRHAENIHLMRILAELVTEAIDEARAPDRVGAGETNERVVAVPYVLRALAGVPRGSAILNVGASDRMLAVSLASLGYRVTALDTRPHPYQHPLLETVVGSIHDWDNESDLFDAVVYVSSIKYGRHAEPATAWGSDVTAMRRIRELTKPRGLLVLTAPLANPSGGGLAGTSEQPGLDPLLDGWEIEDLTVVRSRDDATWMIAEAGVESVAAERGIALVTARLADGEA